MTKFTIDAEQHTTEQREAIIRSWHATGGVVIIGTDTLRNLITLATRNQENAKTPEEQKAAEGLLPNPCLLVVDEAHILAKSETITSKVCTYSRYPRVVHLPPQPYH